MIRERTINVQGNAPAKTKPVYLMNQLGTTPQERNAVLDGAKELIRIAGANGIQIYDLDVWRNRDFMNPDGTLKDFQSIDWYVSKGIEKSPSEGALNVNAIERALLLEPWRKPEEGGRDHYDLLILHDDLYSENYGYILGLSQKRLTSILSTHKFKELDDKTRYETIKTLAMHELGHAFGLIPSERNYDVEQSLGKHCMNTCIMRQGKSIPNDWIQMTNDRLRYGALCNPCENDIKQYFRN